MLREGEQAEGEPEPSLLVKKPSVTVEVEQEDGVSRLFCEEVI